MGTNQGLTARSLTALCQGLAAREFSAVELTEAYLEAIDAREGEVGAYLTLCPEGALAAAARCDERRAAGAALPPLAGIPMGVKDNICVRGLATTCGSKMLEHYISPYNAHVMDLLADCVLLGKLNMDEFAMGSSTENSAFHPTRNPRDTSRVPGGSSGGSAAAVAAGEAAFALGSDTGGSIRQPASFCGVVGMKPTYGSVSRYGLVAFASSLDQIGPLTAGVADNALVLNALMGHDGRDATSVSRVYGDNLARVGQPVAGLTLGLAEEFFGEGVAPEVAAAVEAAAKGLEAQGARLVRVGLPHLKNALPAYYILSSAEASSNLARFDGVRFGFRAEAYGDMTELYKKTRSQGFGPEVKRRIMLGTFVLSAGYYDAFYKKAQQMRAMILAEFQAAFTTCDALLAPVAPTVAYPFGAKADPLEMYRGDVLSVPVNIAGLPALSMPCGADRAGLPIGLQWIGPAFSEPLLYQLGAAAERR